MSGFQVIKRDAQGIEQVSYAGQVIERGDNFVCIDAVFSFSDRDLGYIHLWKGDVFREWFYSDRWYNIFRVQDRYSRQLKGWYCNITRPAEIEAHQVAADDLALDIFVYPDGRSILLDEDEFKALNLSDAEEQAVWDAVDTIRRMISGREFPFDEILDD